MPCTLTLSTEGGSTTVDFHSPGIDSRAAVAPGVLNLLLRVPR